MSMMSVRGTGSVASLQSVGAESLSKKSYESLPGLTGVQPQNIRRAMFRIPHALKRGGLKVQHTIAKVFQATKRACVTRFGTCGSGNLATSKRASSKPELPVMVDDANPAVRKPGEPVLRKNTPTGDKAMLFTESNTNTGASTPTNTDVLTANLDHEAIATLQEAGLDLEEIAILQKAGHNPAELAFFLTAIQFQNDLSSNIANAAKAFPEGQSQAVA